jgi:hypothetical protein
MHRLIAWVGISLFLGSGPLAEVVPAGDRLETSLQLTNFSFDEHLAPPQCSSESGDLLGVRLAYEPAGSVGGYAPRLLLEYANDTTTFVGTRLSGEPARATTRNRFITFEGDIGLSHIVDGCRPRWHRQVVVWYTGLGVRAWERDLGGWGGYTEEYRWIYLPIGLRTEFPLTSLWTLGVDVAARATLHGRAKIRLSELDPKLNDPNASFGNRVGFRVELPLTAPLSDTVHVRLAPWYERYAFAEGEAFVITDHGYPVDGGILPASTTEQYGLNLGLVWEFAGCP